MNQYIIAGVIVIFNPFVSGAGFWVARSHCLALWNTKSPSNRLCYLTGHTGTGLSVCQRALFRPNLGASLGRITGKIPKDRVISTRVPNLGGAVVLARRFRFVGPAPTMLPAISGLLLVKPR